VSSYAYGQGTGNALRQMAWGGGLGGRVDPATVNRAYHNAALLWRGASPDFGVRRMPNLDLTGRLDDPRAAGQTWSPNNPTTPWRQAPGASWVGLAPYASGDLARTIASPATRALVHEWGHVFQSPQT